MIDLQAAIKLLEVAFADASTPAQRDLRNTTVKDPVGDDEAEWMAYERRIMHEVTNNIRATADLPPVAVGEIFRVEVMASGHSDYYLKFPFYCAEIAVGLRK